ncbi:uncharacterized protein LOC142175550 [Nicotiana tabacum]|uniref:Uncharacterized protein LOC142175550 n=1 Tax=Nicotiana tabacum TaxID=4097 RepID=A0AC58TN59_TOBAC
MGCSAGKHPSLSKVAIPENSTINGNNGADASTRAVASSVILDHNHPLYLHPSDGPRSMSVGLILTGVENYSLWSRAMKVALLGKNKLCLVNGSTSKKDFGSNLGSHWDRCNAILTSWLMSNMSRDLVTGVLFSSNAQKVWAAFKERFDKVNASRLYYLHKEIFTLTQGISSVSTYFTKLKDLWAEYDSILPPPPSATEYVDQLEYQRLLQFLMGLNDNFEQARSQILLMPTLPSIDKAYTMVVQDESRKLITGGSYGQAGHNGPTALFTAHSTSRSRRNYSLECDFLSFER